MKKKHESLVSNQRPNVIDKRIRLPVDIKQGEEKIESAKYSRRYSYSNYSHYKEHGKNISIRIINILIF